MFDRQLNIRMCQDKETEFSEQKMELTLKSTLFILKSKNHRHLHLRITSKGNNIE